MKISKKLDRRIRTAIIVERIILTDLLDEKFRNDKIDHVTWKELMTAVIAGSNNIEKNIDYEIHSYVGGR